MIKSFKDEYLEKFFRTGKTKEVPSNIANALSRKLDILDAAASENDLRVPPGNRFEHLQGNLSHLCSIRINKQYRLIFEWQDGQVSKVYLDPHTYR